MHKYSRTRLGAALGGLAILASSSLAAAAPQPTPPSMPKMPAMPQMGGPTKTIFYNKTVETIQISMANTDHSVDAMACNRGLPNPSITEKPAAQATLQSPECFYKVTVEVNGNYLTQVVPGAQNIEIYGSSKQGFRANYVH